jgi:hypothetical protein
MVKLGPGRKQFGKPALCQTKDRLIVPKRIIGIDTDCGDAHHLALDSVVLS